MMCYFLQLLEKLQSAECSIENLAQQLQAIQMSGGAPSTLRREQDDMLINIQEKHQQEMNCLSEKLDKANHIVNEKVFILSTRKQAADDTLKLAIFCLKCQNYQFSSPYLESGYKMHSK